MTGAEAVHGDLYAGRLELGQGGDGPLRDRT